MALMATTHNLIKLFSGSSADGIGPQYCLLPGK